MLSVQYGYQRQCQEIWQQLEDELSNHREVVDGDAGLRVELTRRRHRRVAGRHTLTVVHRRGRRRR